MRPLKIVCVPPPPGWMCPPPRGGEGVCGVCVWCSVGLRGVVVCMWYVVWCVCAFWWGVYVGWWVCICPYLLASGSGVFYPCMGVVCFTLISPPYRLPPFPLSFRISADSLTLLHSPCRVFTTGSVAGYCGRMRGERGEGEGGREGGSQGGREGGRFFSERTGRKRERGHTRW